MMVPGLLLKLVSPQQSPRPAASLPGPKPPVALSLESLSLLDLLGRVPSVASLLPQLQPACPQLPPFQSPTVGLMFVDRLISLPCLQPLQRPPQSLASGAVGRSSLLAP